MQVIIRVMGIELSALNEFYKRDVKEKTSASTGVFRCLEGLARCRFS